MTNYEIVLVVQCIHRPKLIIKCSSYPIIPTHQNKRDLERNKYEKKNGSHLAARYSEKSTFTTLITTGQVMKIQVFNQNEVSTPNRIVDISFIS